MHKKAPVLIVLGVVVLAGAYFLFSRHLAGRLDGMGDAAAPAGPALELYRSDALGVSFGYPSGRYDIGTPEDGSLVLMPEGYAPPQGGEGPPTITMSAYSDAEGLPLEQFLQNEPRTNFGLSADKKLEPLTVNELPALSYRYSGLYESDAIAVLNGKRVYIFTVSWANESDQIRADFMTIINSLAFIPDATR